MDRFEHEGNVWVGGEIVELTAKRDLNRAERRRRVFVLSEQAIARIEMMVGANGCERTSCNLERVLIGMTPEMWREARRRFREANPALG